MRTHAKFITSTIVIFTLWIAAVFDPIGNLFMLRYLALGGALTCLVLFGFYKKLFGATISLRTIFIVYISFVMPIYGLMMYVISGGYTSQLLDTSYLAAGLLLLTSLLYEDERLCKIGIRAMLVALRLLVIIIVGAYATGTFDLHKEWISFFTERNVAIVSFREVAEIKLPYVYFLASPMLIYLIAHDLNKLFSSFSTKYVLTAASSIFAFALSGTRAHILLALAYTPLFYILTYSRNKVVWISLCLFLAASVGSLFSIEILSAFFSVDETSNAMKLHMISTYSEIFDDPVVFIFGQGYNAHAWSPLLRGIIATEIDASKTELTYIEAIRVYGLLVSMPFLFLLVVLAYRVSKTSDEYRWLFPAYLIYLVNSSINPYLFSSNGMLPLGLIAAIALSKGKWSALERMTPTKNGRVLRVSSGLARH